MGMRISNSGDSSSVQGVSASSGQQRQQSLKDLISALKAGDLGSAQKAFASLPGAANSASSNSPLAQIGKALQSGDLSGAQQAAQTWQAARSGHHHHHHGGQTAAVGSATNATPAAPSGTGALLDVTA